HFIRQVRRDAHGAVEAGVQVGDGHRVADRAEGRLVGGLAVDEAAPDPAAEEYDRAGAGEVAGPAIVGQRREPRRPDHPGAPPPSGTGGGGGPWVGIAGLTSGAIPPSVRPSRPRSCRSRTSWAMGRSIWRIISAVRVWPLSCVSQPRNGTYSVVPSTKRAPASTSRRASRQPRPKRPVL